MSIYGLCICLRSVLTLSYDLCLYIYSTCVHLRYVSPSTVCVDIILWSVSRYLRCVSPSMVCVSVFGLCLRLRSVLTLFYGLCLYIYSTCVHLRSVSPSHLLSFVSVVLSLDEGDYPENVQIVRLIFHVFGSCFRPLAVILASDLCE